MFYIGCIKKKLNEDAARIDSALSTVESEEFKAKYRPHEYAAASGLLAAIAFSTVHSIRGYLSNMLAYAEPQIAYGERLVAVCEALGIDEGNLAELEILATDPRYKSERDDVRKLIASQAGGVKDDAREREYENSCKMLEAGGFVPDPEDDDILTRTTPGTGASQENAGRFERIQIETKRRHSDFWYEFTLERNEQEVLNGRSGEFFRLLEAVGISQEVAK